MKRTLISFFCCFLANFSLSASVDTTIYLTPQDTIFIKFGEFQEKVIEHTMEVNQTLYSLARFYGIKVNELFYYNSNLKSQIVPVGTKIKIPIPNRAVIRYKTKNFDPAKHVPVCYRVQKGDNLFRISKIHFRMPLDSVIIRNQLTSENLYIGQILQVGWMKLEGIQPKLRKFQGHPAWKQNQKFRRTYVRGSQAKKERTQQGVAFWQKEKGNKKDFYALHRTAPINSIVGVTNPMNNRTIYAKVLGRIPETVYGDEVVVIVSGKTAEALGAKDKRFFVKLKYLR